MPSRSQLMIVVAVALAACQTETGSTAGIPIQIEDSAGVRIVEYMGTPVINAPFRFSAEPLYRHGANPGDYAFQGIHPGSLLPDGSAVVSDVFNEELVVLSPDGTTHEVLAGPGEGPGDVSYVGAVFALGQDRVLAADRDLYRVTVFAGGSVERTVDIRRMAGLGVQGIGSSGQLLMATNSFRSGFEGEWLPGHMARFDMGTGALDTVASYDFISRPPQALRWNPIGAVGTVAVASGQFVYGRSDRPEVTWRLPDGTVTQIVRWQAEPAPLTEELLDGIEAGLRAGNRMANPGAPDADIDRMTDDDMAVYRAVIGGPMPLFTIPFGDAEGRVWLPSYRPGGAREGASDYTVVSADGEWLGTVEAPPRFRILDVAGGLVLGVNTDDMDVESVVVYELEGDTTGQRDAVELPEATSANSAVAETDGAAADQEPTKWWVEIDAEEGNPIDTMGNAYSPPARPPEALADVEGDFRSRIRYLCLNANERERGNIAPAYLVFWEQPRPTAPAVPGSIVTGPLQLRTIWGEEAVVLQAQAIPPRYRIFLDQEDAQDRGTGESSDAEFVRRLLESPSTASDSLVIELDWEEVGVVRYTYPLEGAADAIREAGRPCGMR